MKKLISIGGLVLAWVLSAVVQAAGVTGGGNVVVCAYEDGTRTVRLLDYYEAEVLMPSIRPDLGTGTTELELVETALKRLERLDRNRADKYRRVSADFFKHWIKVSGVTLPDIGDHGYIPIDHKHCRKEQVAVQNISPFPQSKKYTVREEYWNAMSLQDRAGLILHEVIYEDALSLGHKTSANSRYINSLISSPYFETLSAADFAERLRQFGFDPIAINHPPRWLVTPLNFTVKEGETREFRLSLHASDPDNDVLQFSLRKGHPDVRLTGAGVLAVAATHGGKTIELEIGVSDGVSPESPTTTVSIFVETSAIGKTVSLVDAWVGEHYSTPILNYFTCKTSLWYSSSHPEAPWARVTADAQGVLQITGTPGVGNEGLVSIPVEVKCSEGVYLKPGTTQLTETIVFQIKVHQKPAFPIIARLENGFANVMTSWDLTMVFSDCSVPGKCTFSSRDLPQWLTLSADGRLIGTPRDIDLGIHQFMLAYTVGDKGVLGRIVLEVLAFNPPPLFLENPIRLGVAHVGAAFFADLSKTVAATESITWRKVAGPAWLVLSANGVLMGTPRPSDVGPAAFIVGVCGASSGCADSKVELEVRLSP